MNSAEQAKKVVIIGAGHGGGRTAITLREAGYSGEITILGTEESLPYERPGLSKGFLQGEEKVDDLYLQPSSWYGDNDVTRRTGVEVTNIDPQGRQVTFRETARNSSNGSDDVLSEEQSYETLVLATGSEPRKLDLAGAGAQNICYLRSIDDSQRLRSQLAQAQRVAIIGAGWIGARGRGCRAPGGLCGNGVEPGSGATYRSTRGDFGENVWRVAPRKRRHLT